MEADKVTSIGLKFIFLTLPSTTLWARDRRALALTQVKLENIYPKEISHCCLVFSYSCLSRRHKQRPLELRLCDSV